MAADLEASGPRRSENLGQNVTQQKRSKPQPHTRMIESTRHSYTHLRLLILRARISAWVCDDWGLIARTVVGLNLPPPLKSQAATSPDARNLKLEKPHNCLQADLILYLKVQGSSNQAIAIVQDHL